MQFNTLKFTKKTLKESIHTLYTHICMHAYFLQYCVAIHTYVIHLPHLLLLLFLIE